MRTQPAVTLHSHLRMEGSWWLTATEPAGPQDPRHGAAGLASPTSGRCWPTRAWTAVGLRLGMLDLVATAHEDRLVGHLGPDVLGPRTGTPRAVVAPMSPTRTGPSVSCCSTSGCWPGWARSTWPRRSSCAASRPWAPAGEVADLPALVDLVQRLMLANRDRGLQITTGDAREGRRNYVHARSGRPCLRCGQTVRVAMIGPPPRDRTAFYCPRCQPGPTPTDDGRPQAPLGAGRRSGRKRLP